MDSLLDSLASCAEKVAALKHFLNTAQRKYSTLVGSLREATSAGEVALELLKEQQMLLIEKIRSCLSARMSSRTATGLELVRVLKQVKEENEQLLLVLGIAQDKLSAVKSV